MDFIRCKLLHIWQLYTHV